MMLRCWDIKRKNDPWICFSHYPIIPRTMGESVTTMHEPFQAIATVIGSRHIPFPSRAIRCHSCCTTRRVSTCNDTSPCCTCSCHAICFRLFFFFFLFSLGFFHFGFSREELFSMSSALIISPLFPLARPGAKSSSGWYQRASWPISPERLEKNLRKSPAPGRIDAIEPPK